MSVVTCFFELLFDLGLLAFFVAAFFTVFLLVAILSSPKCFLLIRVFRKPCKPIAYEIQALTVDVVDARPSFLFVIKESR